MILGARRHRHARATSRSRRYAIVAAAVVAGLLTPPDAISMMMLMVPLYGLYEFAIAASRHPLARRAGSDPFASGVVEVPQTQEGPETLPGGGRVGGSGPI